MRRKCCEEDPLRHRQSVAAKRRRIRKKNFRWLRCEPNFPPPAPESQLSERREAFARRYKPEQCFARASPKGYRLRSRRDPRFPFFPELAAQRARFAFLNRSYPAASSDPVKQMQARKKYHSANDMIPISGILTQAGRLFSS